MVKRELNITGHFVGLVASDQGGKCDGAAIPRANPRGFPAFSRPICASAQVNPVPRQSPNQDGRGSPMATIGVSE